MKPARILAVLIALLMTLSMASAGASATPAASSPVPTAEEVANAVPRDLVIDHRGLGYMRGIDGSLTPYGHDIAADNRPIEPKPGPPPGAGPPGSGCPDGIVCNAEWTNGGSVHAAAGRIIFEMSDGWYVCSGTAVTDGVGNGRSIVLTAAHCIYDDVAKAFALNAFFIPGQDDGGADGSDFNCSNDPEGCWILDHGVVDDNWTTRTFPDNIEWDYGFYVVSDTGAHSNDSTMDPNNFNPSTGDLSLDGTVGSLGIDFSTPSVGSTTHALGYSYSVDPEFMYCAEGMSTEGAVNYWLGNCDLSGGSSGGPWVQPMDEGTGNGPIISVNSWGYTRGSGMAGPMLHDNSAGALFTAAQDSTLGGGGVIVGGGGDPEPPPPDPGEGSYTTTAINNGGTWTARVENGGAGVSGHFVGGPTCSNEDPCDWPGIAKRTGSVTFIASDDTEYVINKP